MQDSGAKVALVAQEVYPQIQPLLGTKLERAIVAAYSDYIDPVDRPAHARGRERAAAADCGCERVTLWLDALAANRTPGPLTMGPDDLCVIPYSSGTTGRPKGCMLTHRNVMHTLVTQQQSGSARMQDSSQLVVLPFFHVTSMQGGMNAPMLPGQHHRADVPLGSRCRRRADPALQADRVDRDLDHGHRLPRQSASRANTTCRRWSACPAAARRCRRRSANVCNS